MRLGENTTIPLNCVLTLDVLPFKTVFFYFSFFKLLFLELLKFCINLDHILYGNFNY